MVLTHLVLLEFWTGATPAAAATTFSGYLSLGPWAFFDGFSEAAVSPTVTLYIPTWRPRRRRPL